MSEKITITPEECLRLEMLFLVRVNEQSNWERRIQHEPVGSIIKFDLRNYGITNRSFGYYTHVYREATYIEKLKVVSGQMDVIINRRYDV